MGLGDTAATVQKRLYENAWPRKEGGPPVAFNGLDYRNHPTLPTTAPKRRRGLGNTAEQKKESGKTSSVAGAGRKRPTKLGKPEVVVAVTRMVGKGGRCVGRC